MSTSEQHSVLDGVVPILVTPFDRDDEIDWDGVANQVEFLAASGIRCVGLGFGSEVDRLTPDEVADLIGFVARAARDRVDVVGNADVASVRAGVAAARRAGGAGASFVMLRPAGLAGVPEADLSAALTQVAREAGVPALIQDAPQNTGVELPAATLARLLRDVPEVAAVKVEPPAAAPKISRVVAELDDAPARILGGLGGQDLVHELDRGGTGTMPGPAFPEVFRAVCDLHARGRRTAAAKLLGRVLPLVVQASRGMHVFLYQQKHILRARGVISSERLRRPHPPLEPGLGEETDALMDSVDLDGLLGEATSVVS